MEDGERQLREYLLAEFDKLPAGLVFYALPGGHFGWTFQQDEPPLH